MTVYVDHLRNHGWRMRGRLIQSCHLLADTPEELHMFAARIGLKRQWAHHGSTLHYDLTPSRRSAAVEAGAKEINDRELVKLVRKLRKKK